MTNEQKKFLIELVNTPGPSGFEENIQNVWMKEVSKFCPGISKDVHGNLTATLNPGKDKSIMIVGHSDEIGLIVNYINADGFIFFKPIGGVDTTILASHRARIITKKGIVHGAIGRTSLHLLAKKDINKELEMQNVWIDIGAKNKKDAEKYVTIGDPVVFGGDYEELSNDYAMVRCWDNRVGIYVAAETLRRLANPPAEQAGEKKLNKTVYGVSSVQEETGVWGAGRAAYFHKPTAAIAIDVFPCTDSPEISKEKHGDTKIGKGVVITRGVRSNNKLSDELIDAAKKNKIPFQYDVDYGHTNTDADPISSQRSGVPTGVVSVATRYLHSSVEILSLSDIDLTVDLLVEYILSTKLEY